MIEGFDSLFGSCNTGGAVDKSMQRLRELKDRMRTTILRAKTGTKQQFIEELARDYINISRWL